MTENHFFFFFAAKLVAPHVTGCLPSLKQKEQIGRTLLNFFFSSSISLPLNSGDPETLPQ